MPIRRRPLTLAVEPVETRSTTASERPSRGAASTEPEIVTSSASTPIGRRARPRRDRVRGCDAQPGEVGERLLRRPVRHRRLERAAGEAELGELDDVGLASTTRFAPVIPAWTTPSWTYSGMSCGRTSSRSTGAFCARDVQRALAGLEAEAGSGEELERGRRHPALRGDGDEEAAFRPSLMPSPLARALEREPRSRRRRGAATAPRA